MVNIEAEKEHLDLENGKVENGEGAESVENGEGVGDDEEVDPTITCTQELDPNYTRTTTCSNGLSKTEACVEDIDPVTGESSLSCTEII